MVRDRTRQDQTPLGRPRRRQPGAAAWAVVAITRPGLLVTCPLNHRYRPAWLIQVIQKINRIHNSWPTQRPDHSGSAGRLRGTHPARAEAADRPIYEGRFYGESYTA
jgi:hypothetical protein